MEKAVIYTRETNTHAKNREQGLANQRQICREYAEKNGFEIVGEYFDISSTLRKRPAFVKMIDDIRKQKIGVILVSSVDRFTRQQIDIEIYKAQGIRVVSVKGVY